MTKNTTGMQRSFTLSIASGSIVLSLAFAGCTGPSPDRNIDVVITSDNVHTAHSHQATIARLEGKWKDEEHTEGLRFHEHWETGDDSLKGLGFVMSGGDTVFVEQLAIRHDAEGAEYRARIATQNEGQWIGFPLRPTGADTLWFENLEHDFPQRIIYMSQADGGMHVLVNGTENDTLREELFRYKRDSAYQDQAATP